MPIELETGLPSVRLFQTFTKEQKEIEIKLLTNDVIVGKVRWQDQHCICLVDSAEQQTIVWRQAIAYVKSKS